MFGPTVNLAQAEKITELIREHGSGRVDCIVDPKREGLVVFSVDDLEFLLTTDGTPYENTYANQRAAA